MHRVDQVDVCITSRKYCFRRKTIDYRVILSNEDVFQLKLLYLNTSILTLAIAMKKVIPQMSQQSSILK